MVVRLKDLEEGTAPKKSELVRLSDLAPPPPAQPEIPPMTTSQFKQQFGSSPLDLQNTPLMQKVQRFERNAPPQPAPQQPQQALDTRPDLRTNYPGGALNPVNDLNALRKTRAGQTVDRFVQALGHGMGLSNDEMSSPASSGNAKLDKALDVVGAVAGPFAAMQGVPLSTGGLPGVQMLAGKAAATAGGGLAGKLASSAVTGAVEGAYQNVGGTLATSDNPTVGKLAESATAGALLGGGTGVAGKYIGTKLGSALDRFKQRSQTVAPEAEQATQQIFSTYKKPIGPQPANDIKGSIMEEASNRITPPLENPKLLDKYLIQHLGEDIPKDEITKLSYNDKAELAQYVKDNLSLHDVAQQVAKERGYNWNDLIGHTEPAPTEPVTPQAEPQPVREPVAAPEATPAQSTVPPIQEPTRPAEVPQTGTRERGHTQTVRTSETTPEPLKEVLSEPELYKTRSTKKLYDDAQKFIQKNGYEHAYDFVMNAKKMTDKHNAVAQILAKQFASNDDISRAIDVVSKTAKSGTELGRAIQSLSLWNRMDTEGAMLLAQRQLNRGNVGEYRTLTPEQAKPVIAATEKIKQVEQTKSLAEEVMDIVANKGDGTQLTPEELAKIKEFQKQVSDINGKVRKFLPEEKAAKPRKVVEDINKVDPKMRSRQQVIDYWEARAELARKKLAKQRTIGLLPNTDNPVLLYAELGVSKLMSTGLKFADFADAMVKQAGESVKPIMQQVYNRSIDLLRKSQGLPTNNELTRVVNQAVKNSQLTEEEAARLQSWAKEISFYTDDNLRTEAANDLQIALKSLNESTLGNKISTAQASLQLLSVPTLIRNVVGNEAFNLLQKLDKVTAVPIDWLVSRLTKERHIVFRTGNQEKYWKNFVQGARSGWKGVSPNGQFASMDIHPEAFKSDLNPFKYLQKATGAMLQSFDHAAYMRAYGETLATYAKISGKSISELDQSIHDIADQAGQYATFQDDTLLSRFAVGAKRVLNKPTDLLADALVNKGVLSEKYSFKGFGLGDLVLKYAKTPANIIMRGIDYSPIGILRGLGEIIPAFTKKGFDQRKAVLALSRGITGTLGLSGLGFILVKNGILTGPSSSDPDIRSLDTMTGKGEYKVNWSALERYVMSGLDKNAAQWQTGDRIFDWGWLQPMAISLAMGVNAQQSMAKQKAEGQSSKIATARDALWGSLQTIMQQPLLQGMQNLASGVTNLAKYGSWTGIANIFKGAPASFVPALSNQTRNFTDNTGRNTYDPNGWKQALNMVINKIPGLDKRLPIAYDTLGNPKEQIQGGQAGTLSQGLKSFVSPVKTTQYQVSPEAQMVLDLINSSGKTTVAPRTPNKYVMVDKKKINLTPDQYTELQQRTGQETAKALSRLASMLANPNIKDDNKVKAVTDALTRVGLNVKSEMAKEYPELQSHPTRR